MHQNNEPESETVKFVGSIAKMGSRRIVYVPASDLAKVNTLSGKKVLVTLEQIVK